MGSHIFVISEIKILVSRDLIKNRLFRSAFSFTYFKTVLEFLRK